MENFLRYRKFIYKEDALELIKILKDNDIDYQLEENPIGIDANFGADVNNNEFILKIDKNVFGKVEKLEEELMKSNINNVDENYYLYEFSDEELIEIIIKKEEWNKFDYLLAQKILKDKGKEINSDLLNVIEKQKIEELTREEKLPKMWIYFGYFFAVIGGFLGVLIGYYIMTYKRTLSNGESVYLYKKEDRKQGQNILICSIIGIAFWLIIRVLN